MCKVRSEVAAGQVLSTGEENPAGLWNWLWNTEMEEPLSGAGEYQLSMQMGVRTGHIPELGNGVYEPQENWCVGEQAHPW